MKIVAIEPGEFDAGAHRLPVAGELLLPGAYVCVRPDGRVYALRAPLLPNGACGTVVELCRRGEGVEVALNAERQADGGFFFAAVWVVDMTKVCGSVKRLESRQARQSVRKYRSSHRRRNL